MNKDKTSPDFLKSVSIYTYVDGSNNSYDISKESIEYDPISPMMSNTGFYSGGPPALASINEQQLAQIKKAFEQAAASTDDHLDNRPKGSGTIVIYATGKTYVLKRSATSNIELENLLKELLKNNS